MDMSTPAAREGASAADRAGPRVLSIDGGGVRGLIPALVLADLEARSGRPVADAFDLVAGTSTGGILAAALTVPGADGRPAYAAADLVGLYEQEGPRIFARSLLRRVVTVGGLVDERYDDDGLVAALDRYLGPARLSQALTAVVITAYDLAAREAVFFRSSRPHEDARMADAVRATSAAPTYFEPLELDGRVLVDGGVFAPNPAMCAYAEVARGGRAPAIVVSLGTGRATRPFRADAVRGWGRLQWARPILDVVFDGVADTVDFQLDQLLGRDHLRLQTDLLEASDDLDDASPANLRALRREGERLVRREAATLDALAERLAIMGA